MMEWLIKLLGGYTESEIERVKIWTEVNAENHIRKSKLYSQLFSEDPVSKYIIEIKDGIDKENYIGVAESISALASILDIKIDNDPKNENLHSFFKHIDMARIELYKSIKERLKQKITDNEKAIEESLRLIRGFDARLCLPINSLELSARARGCLNWNSGIIGDLIVLGNDGLIKIRNIGKGTIVKIQKAVESINITFDIELPDDIIVAIKNHSELRQKEKEMSDKLETT